MCVGRVNIVHILQRIFTSFLAYQPSRFQTVQSLNNELKSNSSTDDARLKSINHRKYEYTPGRVVKWIAKSMKS